MIASTQPCASTAPAPTSSDRTNSATPHAKLDSWPTQQQESAMHAQVDALPAPTQLQSAIAVSQGISSGTITYVTKSALLEPLRT